LLRTSKRGVERDFSTIIKFLETEGFVSLRKAYIDGIKIENQFNKKIPGKENLHEKRATLYERIAP